MVQVITGVGKHSMNGKARILPAVTRYLTEAGWKYHSMPDNPGVLNVVIGGVRRF